MRWRLIPLGLLWPIVPALSSVLAAGAAITVGEKIDPIGVTFATLGPGSC